MSFLFLCIKHVFRSFPTNLKFMSFFFANVPIQQFQEALNRKKRPRNPEYASSWVMIHHHQAKSVFHSRQFFYFVLYFANKFVEQEVFSLWNAFWMEYDSFCDKINVCCITHRVWLLYQVFCHAIRLNALRKVKCVYHLRGNQNYFAHITNALRRRSAIAAIVSNYVYVCLC